LPKIYSGLSLLPQIKARYSSDVEKFVTEQEYNRIFNSLSSYMGALDKFADFYDLAHPGAVKVIEASLAEMLTDIYQELKDFVLLYETDTLENMNDAIADFLNTFERYWGVKLLTAARIIHVNLYQKRYADTKKKPQPNDDELLGYEENDDDDDDSENDENIENYESIEIFDFDEMD
jgi:hypothetical protein